MALRRIGAIALGTLGRAVFGAVLSFVILIRMPGEEAVEAFQLLLLQSVLAVLLSGSAFIRGIAVSDDVTEGAAQLRALGLTALALTALLALSDALLIPREFRERYVTLDGWKLGLIALAAFAAAIHAALQGLLVRKVGALRAFGPAGIVGLLMAVLAVVLPVSTSGHVLALFAAMQVLALCALIGSAPGATAILKAALRRSARSARNIGETLLYGAVNGVYLAGLFAVRADWAERVPAERAEIVFFAMRNAELVLQILGYALSMSARVAVFSRRPSYPLAIGLSHACAVGLGLLGIGALAAIIAERPEATGIGAILLFTAMQAISDLFRVPAMAVQIEAARKRRHAWFVTIVLGAITFGAGSYFLWFRDLAFTAMPVFLLMMAGSVIAIWLMLSAISTTRRS